MAGLDLFYLGVTCNKTKKPFHIKYCKGADEVWVRMQGVKEVQTVETIIKDKGSMPIDLNNIRVSPRYACPHCGSVNCGSGVVDLKSGGGRPTEIMLVFDTSGSMDGSPIVEAKKAACNLVNQLDLTNISVGLAVFATSKKVAFSPTKDKQKIVDGINKMDRINVGGGTSAIPFDIAFKQFKLQGAKQFLIVLTDGQWYDQKKAIAQAGQYKQKGSEIIAIGFGGVDKKFLEAIASSPQNALYTDLSKLAKTFSDFSLSIITGKGQ